MRKIKTTYYILASIFFLSENIFAQQIPSWSQLQYNTFIFNPAMTGIEGGNILTISARRQYTGLDQAFGTYLGAFQTRAEGAQSAGGIQISSDRLNMIRTNSLIGTYAYYIPLKNENKLSFGLGMSAMDTRLDLSRTILTHAEDPIVALMLNEGGMAWDANFGAHLQLKHWGFGFSSLQTLQNRQIYRNKIDEKAYFNHVRHFALNISSNHDVSENLELSTLLLWRKAINTVGQIDINAIVDIYKKVYLGIAYRDGFSMSFLGGVHVNDQLSMGYSFDLTTHKYYNVLGNTHEVVVRYAVGKSKGEIPVKAIVVKDSILNEQEQRIAQMEKELKELKKNPVKDTIIIKERIPTLEDSKTETKKSDKPESKPKEVTTPTPQQTGPFYIIAGTFSNKEGANKYIQQLKAKGVTGYSILDISNNFYYVHIGKYDDKDKAVQKIINNTNQDLQFWIKEIK